MWQLDTLICEQDQDTGEWHESDW